MWCCTTHKGDLRLEALLKEAVRVRDDKLAEQRESVADRLIKIEKRHADGKRLADQRLDELAATSTQNNTRLTQANASLDQKLSAHVTRIDGTLKDLPVTAEKQHRQAISYCERLDKLIAETTAPIVTELALARQVREQ
eukprot:SAG22_NODE_2976_length_2057_cov_1.168029_4_plen_139_part_00